VKRAGWLVAVLLLVSAGAWAKKEDEPRSHFASEISYARAFYGDPVYAKVFDDDFMWGGLINFTWYPIRNLGLDLGIGTLYGAGHALTRTGRASGEDVELYVLPGSLGLTYRFDFLNEQLVVPSVSAGGDYWAYRENNAFSKRVEGGKNGYYVKGGLGILLDWIEPDSSFNLQDDFGIENVFLELGWTETWMNQEGLNFSAILYQAGFRFEF